MSEGNKQLVRRLVDEAVGKRNLDVLDQIAAGEFAEVAKRWVDMPAGKLVSALGVEDNLSRMRQLGITPAAD